jgi:phage gp29-like protein
MARNKRLRVRPGTAPVTIRDLTQEVATVAKDITYPAFGGIMRPADDVLALKGGTRGLAIYDDLERDAWVYACLHKRKMAVIGRPWIVEPASSSRIDKQAADMVRAHLSALAFDPACYHLMDAILKGRSAGEIMWVRDGNELVPAEVRARNGLRFTFDDTSALRLLTVASPLYGEAVPDRKFIVHRFGAKDGNPHGLGLGHKLWWPVFFKRQGLSFWLQFLDKFGAPTAIGTYQPGVNVQQLEEALGRIAHDAGVALPDGAAIELLEATRGGTATHESLIRYMDEQIAAAILGEGGQKGSGGELASAANLRNDLRLELVSADADTLSATLDATLIAWDVELNLPGATPPNVWREVSEDEDLKARAERDKILFDMGFRPTIDYVRETYGGQWELAAPPKPLAARGLPGVSSPDLPTEFAEGGESVADQAALDTALATIPAEVMQAQMEQLLGPLLKAIDQAGSYEAAMDVLARAYPALDATRLEALLARGLFAAELWGASHAES